MPAPRLATVLASAVAFAGGAEPALAQPGDLDGFAGNGKRILNLKRDNSAKAVAVQPDGRIVVAGTVTVPDGDRGNDHHFLVARFKRGGRLDRTFAGNGVRRIDFPYKHDYATDVAIQENGRIVVVGYGGSSSRHLVSSNYDYAIARLRPNGKLDDSFSGDGKATVDFRANIHPHAGMSVFARAVAVQDDGGIVITGRYFGNGYGTATARLTRRGSLDPGFGENGTLVTEGTMLADARDVALQGDGRIVIAGSVEGENKDDFALARFLPDGALDTSFGVDGYQSTDIAGGWDTPSALALDASDGIVLAGSAEAAGLGGRPDFALARYDSDGALDESFAGDGTQTTDWAAGGDVARAVAFHGDKIVTAGYAWTPARGRVFAGARYLADGTLDACFSGDGKVTTAFRTRASAAEDMALAPNDRMVMAGYSGDGQKDDIAIARFLLGGACD